MPRAKKDEDGSAKAGHNQWGAKKAKNYARRVVNLLTEMAADAGKYKSDIKAVYAEAKDDGIPVRVMREVIGNIRAEAHREKRKQLIENDYPGQLGAMEIALDQLTFNFDSDEDDSE